MNTPKKPYDPYTDEDKPAALFGPETPPLDSPRPRPLNPLKDLFQALRREEE